MAAHARLKIEFTEGDKCHNLMSRLIFNLIFLDVRCLQVAISVDSDSRELQMLIFHFVYDGDRCRNLVIPIHCGRHLGKINGHKSTYVKVW